MIQIQLRRRTVVLAVAAFLAFAGVATTSLVLHLTGGRAEAAHQWNDVPTGNFFHDEIGWLVDQGIANGFTASGTFKPGDTILRQQAALWFANYNNSLEVVENTAVGVGRGTGVSMGAACPEGKRAIAGGGGIRGPFVMRNSRPALSRPPSNKVIWQVDWVTPNDTLQDFRDVTVWALCAPDTIP